MKTIPLTKGQVALVDDEDYPELAKHKWYALKPYCTYYAARRVASVNGRRPLVYMHRVILGAKPGEQCDHLNWNGVDNRRANLRLCTQSQNNQNKPKRRGSSRYLGVEWDTRRDKWAARIRGGGTRRWLGYFHNEDDAAKAYDRAARELFGEFACLNFPTTEGSLT